VIFSNRFSDLTKAIETCLYFSEENQISEENAFYQALEMIETTRSQNGIVYVIGNGGSAGIASHFSTDLIKSLQIPSQTLYDSNLMTCLSNDYGYDTVFSYPLEKLLKPQDLLVAISSSGKSPNIIKGVQAAILRKASVFTLSGFSEQNPLKKLGNLNYWVDRCDYGLVETSHFFLLHTLIDLWNENAPKEAKHAKIVGNTDAKDQISARN